ncbi:MAG: MoaD/ThiS family protein [Nitrososphaerales archaeon]|nr:MoaD/ThiS family protein [Nitrososphaerales archaeon]
MGRLFVKYYAPFDKLMGKKEEELEIEGDKIKVSDLIKLIKKSGKLDIPMESDEALSSQVLIVVDSNIAKLNDYIHDGSIVNILPPISGG